ncbi:SRPBCC family protein [Galbibacter sp. EGI 63066]|uniref:SRPBCC family protein n=1 Tax=Galbibacter sp. EGI 63066 TaxID=2993559 RepID=UPI002248E64C|nr:SRPBCC family protein [Galbibacter sp. EGI 63066]MCX2678699.1 SRPBCC family protein [Galbibacter sp. EGI 63066]
MERITVKNTVNTSAKKVWDLWSGPEHIVKWNTPSEDWHTPHAENDLRVGGAFLSRMEAKDGSFGFDFGGTYDEIVPHKRIAYTLGDGRKVEVDFKEQDGQTEIVSTFDAETQNPIEMQRDGWQAILDNFKKYAEGID